MDIDRDYLERQLHELKDWVDFVHLSLTMDQAHESGKVRLLDALAPREELDKLRFELRTVRYRLELVAANLNGTRAALEKKDSTPSWNASPGAGPR